MLAGHALKITRQVALHLTYVDVFHQTVKGGAEHLSAQTLTLQQAQPYGDDDAQQVEFTNGQREERCDRRSAAIDRQPRWVDQGG